MKKGSSFEEKLQELEKIVSRLEGGQVPLEEMTALYEQGVKLYSECEAVLTSFEKKLKEQENA